MRGSSGWTIRQAAQADLSYIWSHGSTNWGVEQADRYVDGLLSLFDLLAEFPEIARERTEFSPPVRIHPSGVHLIIYRLEGQEVEIIRILHAHQKLTAYLISGEDFA